MTLVGGLPLGMESPTGPCLGMFTAILVSTLTGGGIVYGEFGSARIIRSPWNLYVGVVSAVMWNLSKALVPPSFHKISYTLALYPPFWPFCCLEFGTYTQDWLPHRPSFSCIPVVLTLLRLVGL